MCSCSSCSMYVYRYLRILICKTTQKGSLHFGHHPSSASRPEDFDQRYPQLTGRKTRAVLEGSLDLEYQRLYGRFLKVARSKKTFTTGLLACSSIWAALVVEVIRSKVRVFVSHYMLLRCMYLQLHSSCALLGHVSLWDGSQQQSIRAVKVLCPHGGTGMIWVLGR